MEFTSVGNGFVAMDDVALNDATDPSPNGGNTYDTLAGHLPEANPVQSQTGRSVKRIDRRSRN